MSTPREMLTLKTWSGGVLTVSSHDLLGGALWSDAELHADPMLARNLSVCKMRLSGMTLRAIGREIGRSGDRVRCILYSTARKIELRKRWIKALSIASHNSVISGPMMVRQAQGEAAFNRGLSGGDSENHRIILPGQSQSSVFLGPR